MAKQVNLRRIVLCRLGCGSICMESSCRLMPCKLPANIHHHRRLRNVIFSAHHLLRRCTATAYPPFLGGLCGGTCGFCALAWLCEFLRTWHGSPSADAIVEKVVRDRPRDLPCSALPVACIPWAAYASAAAVPE
jgi:hypothetical protein